MDHEQQATLRVVADHRIAWLLVSIGIDEAQEGIEEGLGRLLEADAVLVLVAQSLGGIPDNGDAIQIESGIHGWALSPCVMHMSIHMTGNKAR